MGKRKKSLFARFVPRIWRLRRQLRKFRTKSRSQIDQAKSAGDHERASYLEHEWSSEFEMIRDEIEVIYTNRLVRQARRMRLSIPSHPTINQALNGTEDENWYFSKLSGEWIFTCAGYASLSKEVKKEQRERIKAWSAMIGMLAGLVGSLAALAAILLSR